MTNSILYGQDGFQLSVNDCQGHQGIDRVLVLDAQYNLLGETGEDGIAQLKRLSDLPIILIKTGYDIQVVYERDQLEDVCMQRKLVNFSCKSD